MSVCPPCRRWMLFKEGLTPELKGWTLKSPEKFSSLCVRISKVFFLQTRWLCIKFCLSGRLPVCLVWGPQVDERIKHKCTICSSGFFKAAVKLSNVVIVLSILKFSIYNIYLVTWKSVWKLLDFLHTSRKRVCTISSPF